MGLLLWTWMLIVPKTQKMLDMAGKKLQGSNQEFLIDPLPLVGAGLKRITRGTSAEKTCTLSQKALLEERRDHRNPNILKLGNPVILRMSKESKRAQRKKVNLRVIVKVAA